MATFNQARREKLTVYISLLHENISHVLIVRKGSLLGCLGN